MGSRARATAEVNQIMRVLDAILDDISHLPLSFPLVPLSFWVLPDAFSVSSPLVWSSL